jgi:urease accessory protein
LLAHEVAVGPSAPGWAGGAVLGGAGAVGSSLLVDPCLPAAPDPVVLGPTAAVLPLAGPGLLTCAVGIDAIEVHGLLLRGESVPAIDP